MEEEPPNSLIERELEAADKDGFSLIDGSEVDDFFTSVSEMDYNFGLLDGVTMLQTPEAEIPRKEERYNARKSLAWDSAFFTSDGVLDAEELSSIIEGSSGRRKKLQHLSGILEDASKSTSGNTTLESLEADLFCDITSSFQKSAESSNLRVPESNSRKQKTGAGNQTRTKKLHQGNMAKPNSALRPSTDLKGDEKPMKFGPVREQVKKPLGSRMYPSSSLLKTPAVSQKSSITSVPSKVPTKTNNTPSSSGRRITRGPVTGDNRTIIPKSSSYAKSSPGSSATSSSRIGVSSTRSSFSSINSSASSRPLSHGGSCGKVTRTVSAPSPNSKGKIPPRFSLKGKSGPESPPSSGRSSKQQHSPSVSPTSSRSDWSSSSSTATLSQEHMVSKDCLDLRRTFSFDNHASRDLDTYLTRHTKREHENELAQSPNGSAQKSLAGSGYHSTPASAKPSRLRMPSPKMGFFDAVKTGERIPKSQTRSIIGTSTPSLFPNKGSIRHSVTKSPPATADLSNHDTPRTSIAGMNSTLGGRLGRKPVKIPEKASSEKTSKEVSNPTSVNISDDKNTAVTFPESEFASHPDANALEVLMKSFSSLSLVKDD